MAARVTPSTAAEGGGSAKAVLGVLRFGVGFGEKLGFGNGNGIGSVWKRVVEDSGEEHAMEDFFVLNPLFSRRREGVNRLKT